MLLDAAKSGEVAFQKKGTITATLEKLKKKTDKEMEKNHDDIKIAEIHQCILEGMEEARKQAKPYYYDRKFHCEWCVYPPCSGCGKRRGRNTKSRENQFALWYCQECWKKEANAEEDFPKCIDCGVKRLNQLWKK